MSYSVTVDFVSFKNKKLNISLKSVFELKTYKNFNNSWYESFVTVLKQHACQTVHNSSDWYLPLESLVHLLAIDGLSGTTLPLDLVEVYYIVNNNLSPEEKNFMFLVFSIE